MRVRFEPTKEQRQIVEMLSAALVPQERICAVITWPEPTPGRGHRRSKNAGHPIDRGTLARVFKKELAVGRDKAQAVVIGKLWKKINEDHFGAIQFYLKAQCGWREASVHELVGKGGAPLQMAPPGSVVFRSGDNGRRVKPANDEKPKAVQA